MSSYRPWQNMKDSVESLICAIERSEEKQSRENRGFLASARRLYGKLPEDNPEATLSILTELSKHGLILNANYDALTRTERAAVEAVALYAGSPRGSYGRGLSFGSAVASINTALADNSGINTGIESAFKALIQSDDDFESIVYDIGRLLRRAQPKSLDYALLADDIANMQNPDRIDQQKISWAKQFHIGMQFKNNQDATKNKPKEED